MTAFTPGGSNKWTLAISPSTGSPTIGDDGTIYLGSHDGNLYAVNPDGTVRWTFDAGGAVGSTPALAADGTIYFHSDAEKLFALTPDGRKKWDFFIGRDFLAPSPVVAKDGTIYIGSHPNRLVAVRPDGTRKWEYVAGGVVVMPPAISANGNICFTSGEFDGQGLYLLNQDGAELWQNTTNSLVTAPVIGKNSVIYVGSFNETRLNAISPETGNIRWSSGGGYNVRFSYYTSAAIAENGLIYYGGAAVNGSSYFYAFNPDGTTNWQYFVRDPVVGSPAIAADGTVYFTTSVPFSATATLYALRGNSPLATSPWPKYRQNLRNTGNVEKPALHKPKKRSDAGFEFELAGEVGRRYRIEATTNFLNWTSLTSFVYSTFPFTFVDPAAPGYPARFYRAVQPADP